MGALVGTVAVVTGAEQPLGHGIARAVAAEGADVALVGDATTLAPVARDLTERAGLSGRAVAVGAALTDRASVGDAFGHTAEAFGRPVGAVVHTAMDPIAYEVVAFEDVDDERWETVWEGTMRTALTILQASFGVMHGIGGRIVFVTPTVSMSGAAGLVPYTAAVEGQRLLAKSAARQWGPDGITVNCLAVAPEQVPIGVASAATSLAAPALGGPGDPERDLGPLVAFLLSDAGHFVSGTTLGADGGVWMAP